MGKHILNDIHWLPIKQFLFLNLMKKFFIVLISRPHLYVATSSPSHLLTLRSLIFRIGDKAFSIIAPKLLCELPLNIRFSLSLLHTPQK